MLTHISHTKGGLRWQKSWFGLVQPASGGMMGGIKTYQMFYKCLNLCVFEFWCHFRIWHTFSHTHKQACTDKVEITIIEWGNNIPDQSQTGSLYQRYVSHDSRVFAVFCLYNFAVCKAKFLLSLNPRARKAPFFFSFTCQLLLLFFTAAHSFGTESLSAFCISIKSFVCRDLNIFLMLSFTFFGVFQSIKPNPLVAKQ